MLCKRQHEAGDAPFAVPLPGSHAAARLQRAAPHPRPHRGCLYRSPRLLELQGQLLLWGTPRAHPALQIWIRGILLRDDRARCEGKEEIPQRPEPMPHGPQSCAGCTQLSPRTRAPGRMLQRQRPEQNPGHAGTMT